MNQHEEKKRIYNSRAWRALRAAKLRDAGYLCERCKEKGYIVAARCVHHKIPIETAKTVAEMERLAFCSLAELEALCFQCHSDIHKGMASRTKEGHIAASQAHLARWVKKHTDV